ncbi:hypothetical protein J4E90_005904 [Alternaria incomplexa]|uniref:uncharacterized protein n=1 Tax=Alternaria incomplexa TaxID=1187928 RepID=UPI00221FD57D|nr:uncharacterized protein J4E90_005904 [Alternaria incomplexa]KAI4912500.1 hypothetical protein J4E90_005904 [Alternaria incomplexa]
MATTPLPSPSLPAITDSDDATTAEQKYARSALKIEYEFWYRHLIFRSCISRPDYGSLPNLPSSTGPLLRLPVYTVGYKRRKGQTGQQQLDKRRATSRSLMQTYKDMLAKSEEKWAMGDSMVREFDVLDDDHWCLEQQVSVSLSKSKGEWSLLLWLDNGRDLGTSPGGPWSSAHFAPDELFPAIQFEQHDRSNGTSSSKPARSNTTGAPDSTFFQSISCLPAEYTKRLNTELARTDAFYAVSPLMRFAATTQKQVLNIVEGIILKEMDPAVFLDQETPSMANLLHLERLLGRHIDALKETRGIIACRGGHAWPTASEKSQIKEAKKSREQLEGDFDHLLERAKLLKDQCTHGLSIIMTNTSIRENQRAMLQQQGVIRLTRLAFIFIPATYVAGLFGMNVRELDGNTVSIWVYFVATVPLLLVSYLFLTVDVLDLGRKSWEALSRFASLGLRSGRHGQASQTESASAKTSSSTIV